MPKCPWHLLLSLVALNLSVGLSTESRAAPAPTPPPPTVSVAQYRAQLQDAATALRELERSAPGPLDTVLKGLAQAQRVQRSDGARLDAGDDEWQQRLADLASGNATRADVHQARAVVLLRLRALDEWSQPRAGGYYQPQDAQGIVGQLESTGQIRTGPTRVQQIMADLTKAIDDFLKRLIKWVSNLFPSRTTPSATPAAQIDERWLWALLISVIGAALSTIGYFVWRASARRLERREAKREVRFLEGEDAELLRLPPDELRERARQLAREGNFREALRHLYISLLLRLDARGVWRYDTRRTNWEHIAALESNIQRAPLVPPLSDLTRRFDRVRYGNAPCAGDEWSRFAEDVAAMESQVIDGPGATASNAAAGAGARS